MNDQTTNDDAEAQDPRGSGLGAAPCSASSDSFDGVEPHLAGGGIGGASGDVGNPDSYLGIVGYDYCPLSEVIRAAESKGVRLLESDLINDEAESVNQGVVLFRGATAQLVDAIYDCGISGPAIEKMLKLLRGGDLPCGRGGDVDQTGNGESLAVSSRNAGVHVGVGNDSKILLENVRGEPARVSGIGSTALFGFPSS